MGLSIHYNGSIKDAALVEPLIAETEDICKSMGWQYHLWQRKEFAPVRDEMEFTPHHLNGISINIEGCEMLSLCFLPNGKMSSLINLLAKDVSHPDWMYIVSVKTQFAGPDAHIAIIKLLRYISDKYLVGFKMDDEGLYWETNDQKKLLSQFERYNFLLNAVATALSSEETKPGESPASLADRIEKIFEELHKKFNS